MKISDALGFWDLYHADCATTLKQLPSNSLDSLVTDPPAGIAFMGKDWDWDKGGASRFFYVAKASKQDRGADNKHPTVKSTKLMAYLCRLVTPPGGTVLDPFAGSGSTGVAALAEGFEFIGIEQEPESFKTAAARLEDAV